MNQSSEGNWIDIKTDLEKIEKYRIKEGFLASEGLVPHGAFFIPSPNLKDKLRVISSGAMDKKWFHVSVSLPNRCPTWKEMSYIKNLFFGENVTAIQFHPKKDQYVNNHPFCLHLWCRMDEEIELPPSILVGIKD